MLSEEPPQVSPTPVTGIVFPGDTHRSGDQQGKQDGQQRKSHGVRGMRRIKLGKVENARDAYSALRLNSPGCVGVGAGGALEECLGYDLWLHGGPIPRYSSGSCKSDTGGLFTYRSYFILFATASRHLHSSRLYNL